MDSCFPPLAGLSLRGSSDSRNKSNRNSAGSDRYSIENGSEKIEILQDLDLYYIRQIARSLKVNFNIYF